METTAEPLRITLGIPATHPDFAGHFPNFPLLPAVSQISLIKALIEQHLGRAIDCMSVSRTKFKAMLRPNTEVLVEISWSSELEARWKIADAENVYSMGSMKYEF